MAVVAHYSDVKHIIIGYCGCNLYSVNW